MKAVIIKCWGFVNAEKFKRVIHEIFYSLKVAFLVI